MTEESTPGGVVTRHREDVKAHEASVELRLSDIVAFLQEQIGPNLTAYIAGKSPGTVARWAKDEQSPSDAVERRLRETYRVFEVINEEDSNHVVRAWLMGMNPELGDETPADFLREDRFREVLIAAKTFRTGG